MAIVPDLSTNFPASLPLGTDGSFSTINRTLAAVPTGVTTPLYSGEIVFETAGQSLWQAVGTTNTSWVPALIEA